jgi:threonine/homoserine/homoserine lactone efflux protein
MGPVFAASIRHGLKNGFPTALSVQLESLLGDIAYACIGLVAAGYLSQFPMIGSSLNIVGAAVMFWLAFNSVQNVISPQLPSDRSRGNAGAFATGALLSFSNVDPFYPRST